MTVIAYRDGVIAADRMSTNSGWKRAVTKLIRHGDVVYGITGYIVHLDALIAWHRAGAYPGDYPKFQETNNFSRLVVARKGSLFAYEDTPFPIDYSNDRFVAFGSGRDFAIGAMECDAGAVKAVSVACTHSDSCGMGIDVFDLNKEA